MLGRLLIAALVMLFLVGLVSAVWNLCDWPPPRLILKYGFPPTGGPTGRTMTIEGVEFVELKPGYFRMGSHFLCQEGDLLGTICALFHLPWGRQPRHDSDECPPHWIEVGDVFWIGRTEVTNAQFERFDPDHKRGWDSQADRGPVVDVSHEDAKAYCAWLSSRTVLRVRLPCEPEWEYACRAGSTTEYCFGDDEARLGYYAKVCSVPAVVFDLRADEVIVRSRPGWAFTPRADEVMMHMPNSWGLYDFHGNVLEWCEELWSEPQQDEAARVRTPSGSRESHSMTRGGCWLDPPVECRSARRTLTALDFGFPSVGFRAAGWW